MKIKTNNKKVEKVPEMDSVFKIRKKIKKLKTKTNLIGLAYILLTLVIGIAVHMRLCEAATGVASDHYYFILVIMSNIGYYFAMYYIYDIAVRAVAVNPIYTKISEYEKRLLEVENASSNEFNELVKKINKYKETEELSNENNK